MNYPVSPTRWVWHYTAGVYVPAIAEAGFLKASNAGAPNEVPLLWYSTNQRWEPTATKMIVQPDGKVRRLTFAEQAQRVGCVRFGLPADDRRLMPWQTACKVAGTPRRMIAALEKVGKAQGAHPGQWNAINGDVPVDEHHFQLWDGSRWCDEIPPPQ